MLVKYMPTADKNIDTLESLVEERQEWKDQKSKVFTNGLF